jgi:hypothetical protein
MLETAVRTRIALMVALALLTISLATGQDKPIEAWWLNTTFAVSETSYDSVPIKAIDPSWVRISILTYPKLPADAKADFSWMRHDGFVFETDNQFSRKGENDRELCGVYEDRDGRKGRFLLVLERVAEGPWNVAYVHREAGEAGFSVLVRRPTGLYWGTCMQCHEFSRLRIQQGNFTLDQAP